MHTGNQSGKAIENMAKADRCQGSAPLPDYPVHRIRCSAYNSLDKRGLLWRFVRDRAGRQIPLLCLRRFPFVIGVNLCQRLSGRYVIPHFFTQYQAYRQVDLALLCLPAAAQNQGADPHLVADDMA